MVTTVTSLSRSGLYDWLLQRLTAIILGAYCLFLIAYLLYYPTIEYAQWRGLFAHLGVKLFTLLALLSLLAHGWVGLWTITTDYLNDRALGQRSVWLRLPVQLLCVMTLFGYLVWGVHILWSC